jgi:hypothetical protein
MPDRFRPQLQSLEARETPALVAHFDGASLLLTGTPSAGPSDALLVRNVGGDNYRVTDGTQELGTYRVTTDLRIRLARFDTRVGVDLGGDTIGGDVLLDVGAGDTDPTTPATVTVNSETGSARVAGDVTFRGGSGQESFVLGTATGATIEIGGRVRVFCNAVTTPVEDAFILHRGVSVRGDVNTSRITYTTVNGTVGGDLTANAADSPGGMGFTLNGTVGGSVVATGGATAADTATASYFSFARVSGRIDGDVRVNVTGGRSRVAFLGVVGGNVRVGLGGDGTVGLYGLIDGDLVVAAAGPSAVVDMSGEVGGAFRFSGGGQTSSNVYLSGNVGGSVMADLGGSTATRATFVLSGDSDLGTGVIGGSVTVRSRAGTNLVQIGSPDEFPLDGGGRVTFPALIAGDLRIDLGNGTNTFTFYGATGSTVGGWLVYTGGTGGDAITVTGRNTFPATIRTGGGRDVVTLLAGATLGPTTIDFGTTPGYTAAPPLRLFTPGPGRGR